MLILGFPYLLVTTYENKRGERVKKNLFRFDEKGEYRTDNEKILKKAGRTFKVIEEPNEIDTSQPINHTDELIPFEPTIDEIKELDKPKRTRGVPRKKKEVK